MNTIFQFIPLEIIAYWETEMVQPWESDGTDHLAQRA